MEDLVEVEGNTYPVRDDLQSKCQAIYRDKKWWVPKRFKMLADVIVQTGTSVERDERVRGQDKW